MSAGTSLVKVVVFFGLGAARGGSLGTAFGGHAEWLGLLIDRETASRSTRKFQTRMRAAKLRHVGACIEDVDYRAPRKLDRALISRRTDGSTSTGTS